MEINLNASSSNRETREEERIGSVGAKVSGLARFIAGIEGSGKMDLKKMNSTIVEMQEALKQRSNKETHEKITIKVGHMKPSSIGSSE